MAESAVSFLLDQLTELLQEKRQLLGRLERDVESIRDELAQMRGFLRDADAREETDSSLQVWITQLREISFDVEDVLDKYMLRCGTNARRGARGCMKRIYVSIKDLRARDKIAHEIQAIKHRLETVTKSRQKYRDMSGVIDQVQGSSSKSECYDDDGRREALYLEDDEVVGIEEPKEELLAWIKSVDNNGLDVIAVVGMGGLGKTTLVKKVFDDESVKRHFNKHVWVVASDYKDVKDLLRSLIKKLLAESNELPPQGLEGMDVDEMRNFIYEYVKESKYIVVVDDIWDLSRWKSIRFAFPKRSHGCIIVTTRFESIAKAACVKSNHVYYLKPLPAEKSKALFYKKAFPKDPCPCPPNLRKFADNILHKCGDLPLAIVVVGGVLATKSNMVEEWERFSRSIINQGSESERLWKLLSLSYNDLPYYLKSCFLYLSIFPEAGRRILHKDDIIRLWIAEGFVESKQHRTMEEVAEDYLNQLSSRSLVQVVDVDTNGVISWFRIHDLLQEYILEKSKEQNMVTICDGRETQWPNKIRRLVLNSIDNFSTHEMKKNIKYLRSLLLSSKLEIELDFISELLDKCRLLKVLEVCARNMTSIPSEVFKLYHLKYLCFSGTKVDHIPKEIKYLENLETLDLEWCDVTELPDEILNLRKLRHLLAYDVKNAYDVMFDHTLSVKAPCNIGNFLTSLQCLCCIDANEVGGVKMVREIGKLTQLRRLDIAKLTSEDGKELCSSIANLTYLGSLKIVSVKEGEKMDLDYSLSSSSSTRLTLLRELELCGCIEKVPQWISSLNALTTLILVWSKLNEDPLNSLCYLPNLAYLWIHEAYVEGLSFKGDGFQKLRKLSLAQFKCLKWVTVEKGSMPTLQKWNIWDCKLLLDLPRGIEHLTKLQDVKFGNMPNEFVDRFFEEKRNEGDNWRMAQVPSFKFGIVKDGFWRFND